MIQTSIFNEDYEQVSFYSDSTVGLKSIIAIHSTILGPSAGGLRIYDYLDDIDSNQNGWNHHQHGGSCSEVSEKYWNWGAK